MPEACFLCIDSSEYMRDGDQFPTRMLAAQEAANLLVNAKIQSNAENTVGFLTTGGSACTVYETLTFDVDRVMARLTSIPISGKVSHFSNGLLIASIALSHRTNPRAEKRIVAFVASPLQETEKDLEQLAKRLRKDDVAVDVVAFGGEDNNALLTAFIEKVNKGGNSRFLYVPSTQNLTDALMSNAILLGEENVAAMNGEGGSGAAGGFGFGLDPNLDPELAMAIRLSMEEEERRRAAVAAAAGGASSEGAPSTNTGGPAETPAQPTTTSQAAAAAEEEMDLENMSEEEMLRRAMAMSLEEAQQQPSAPQQPHSAPTGGNEEDDDPEFQAALQLSLQQNQKDASDKKDGDKD